MSNKSMRGKREEDVRNDYEAFVEKFKPKKTTDDCYTPPLVYDAIKEWACEHYGIDRRKIVRPFYPGADYEKYEYKEGAVVLDNPPFSILAKIVDFYIKKGIDFFLFAPEMTVFGHGKRKVNIVIADARIKYENGAIVNTAFITSFGRFAIEGNTELNRRIKAAVEDENQKSEKVKKLPEYEYPREVLMVNDVKKIVRRGIDVKIARKDIYQIRELDAQKQMKKSMYGSGFLLAKPEAAKLEAAKLEAAKLEAAKLEAAKLEAAKLEAAKEKYIWELSEREKEIISKMS